MNDLECIIYSSEFVVETMLDLELEVEISLNLEESVEI